MATRTRLLTRKNWLRVGTYGTLGAIVALFLAHPYTRQLVFGPRVGGMPLAYWQDRVREAATPAPQRPAEPSFTAKVLRLIGVTGASVGDITTAEALPVLLSLCDDPSDEVREHIVTLLARYPDSNEAMAALIGFLDDPSTAVRQDAVRALGAIEPPIPLAMPNLRARLKDADAQCRLLAACAILPIEQQPLQATVAVLCDASRSVDSVVRFGAIYDLCRRAKQHPAILDALRQAVANEPDLAFDCANGLRQAGPAAAPLLIELLKARDHNARRVAAITMGAIGPGVAEVVPALVALRDDPDESVRYVAAMTLWQIDPQRFARPAPRPPGAPATGM